ncbi:hypothetical protein A2917_00605 [Candidatus Nomurabacteria bacterium RIFCSPLOWO2_01_FULL_42_17]|uniref:DUF4382 domain-containing protein n=1 Tax=Candidatus Nomurabacteria bacterium RIFCSPLOWO2_01_FULL_42_17 TaxID=1801780 RepID=A0A1F6XNG2_9BACT|nr:MAG: hypothetical protein A2917_00605 [Candidatus Nomurabacteria bacterium RIFCSPLOWO2_01_FULL_42_17]
MSNKTIGIIAIIVLVVGAYFLINSAPKEDTENTSGQKNNTQGRVVFSVTDAAADMGTISEINMKVNNVSVHNNTSGWVTVSTTPRVYNLLALNAQNKSELLADIKTQAGSYDQVRLMIDSIAVIKKDGTTKIAKLPSNELKINTMLMVKADETSSVNFDFMADKSLHLTGNGSYIFAPVVKTESRSDANVSVNTSSVVSISGGNLDDSNTIGMDIDGSVKLNFQIKSSQKLNIGSDNMIKLEL